MMRTLVALFTVLALLFCFAGCGGSDTDADANLGTSSTNAPANTESGGSSSQSTSSKQTIVFPDPVTGTYNGKTVTLSLHKVLDVSYAGQGNPRWFTNGYEVCYDDAADKWICFDYDGNTAQITDGYDDVDITPFDRNGVAVMRTLDSDVKSQFSFINTKGEKTGKATKNDFDEYVKSDDDCDVYMTQTSDGSRKAASKSEGDETNAVLDKNGKVICQFPEDYNTVYFNSDEMLIAGSYAPFFYTVRDADGKLLCDLTFENVGNLENGLCAFVSKDGKLGIMSEKGEIIIPATFDIRYDTHDGIFLSEGRIIASVGGKVAVFELTVK